jgi:hypothetical protein
MDIVRPAARAVKAVSNATRKRMYTRLTRCGRWRSGYSADGGIEALQAYLNTKFISQA